MFIETQSTISSSKKCLSCRRNLNYEFFGDSRASKDGFNPVCRLCRNQSRRLSYHKSEEEFFYNLDQSNRSRLPPLKSLVGEFTFKVTDLNDWKEINLTILVTEYHVKFKLFDQSQKSILEIGLFIQNERDKSLNAIHTYILEQLATKSLRLYDSMDEIDALKIDSSLG